MHTDPREEAIARLVDDAALDEEKASQVADSLIDAGLLGRITLGYQQYEALAPLFDDGSPVWLERAEAYEGAIVDLNVRYFDKDRETTKRALLTRDGELTEGAA